MSTGLIDRSPDLLQLRNEGYEVGIANGYVVISHVPYVTAGVQVALGTLACHLELAGDRTARPSDHTVRWVGEFPCDSRGCRLEVLVNNPSIHEEIKSGLVATLSFSQKPSAGYTDYHHKLTAYVKMLEGHARAIDPAATATTFPLVLSEAPTGPFKYADTATSRAGIVDVNAKLAGGRIAIVGLGGTGSYVLDLLAKTPVRELHLFDWDLFLQHNAFRSPGAPSGDEVQKRPRKVDWFAAIYSRMKNGIVPHPFNIDAGNLAELDSMNFVFLCVDPGPSKRLIVEHLVAKSISFIDVGMGVTQLPEGLRGQLRVTTCIGSGPTQPPPSLPLDDAGEGEYTRNIQIADLNALNAALAVSRWKRALGFYIDLSREDESTYAISTNQLANARDADAPSLHPT